VELRADHGKITHCEDDLGTLIEVAALLEAGELLAGVLKLRKTFEDASDWLALATASRIRVNRGRRSLRPACVLFLKFDQNASRSDIAFSARALVSAGHCFWFIDHLLDWDVG
jgi:hypothetical protein